MIGGWKATRVTPVSIGAIEQVGEDAILEWVKSQDRGDWFIRGPRGGRYVARSDQETRWHVDREGFFMQGCYRFLAHRRELRYIRPRTAAARAYDADQA